MEDNKKDIALHPHNQDFHISDQRSLRFVRNVCSPKKLEFKKPRVTHACVVLQADIARQGH